MENVNQDHSRNHETRYDKNREDVDREARNRENQNSQIHDPDHFDIQAQYNDKTHSHFEGDKLQNRNNPDKRPERKEETDRRDPRPDEANPTPNRRTNQDNDKGGSRHNF